MPARTSLQIGLRFFLLLIVLVFLVPVGCSKKEKPKKVSLFRKGGNVEREADKPQPNTLWFGFELRLRPKEEVMIYTPFLKYLERATNKRFRIKFAETHEDTVKNLGSGVTDFAVIGSLSFVIGAHEYGIKYLVSGVNSEGDPRSHSVIFTKPESVISDVRALRGQCFAFGAEMSSEGHLIPRQMLDTAGISLNALGTYKYTGSHIDALKSVLNGECDAGSIPDTLAKRLVTEEKIKVLTISEPYPSSLIAYNAALDSKTVKLVREALLAFEPMNSHKSLLIDWDRTEMPLGFTQINEVELQKVRKLAQEYDLLRK